MSKWVLMVLIISVSLPAYAGKKQTSNKSKITTKQALPKSQRKNRNDNSKKQSSGKAWVVTSPEGKKTRIWGD